MATSNTSEPRVPPMLALAVGLVSAAVITHEIALTRCFSVLLRYHFVFLVVSVATFGLGIGGLLDYLLLRKRPGEVVGWLAWLAAILAPLPALSVLVLFRPPVSHHLNNLWLVGGVSMPPFLVAGMFLSGVWRSFAGYGGRLYAADLAGAGVGSVAVILSLQLFGGTGTPMAAGALIGLGAVGLAWQAGGLVRKAVACVVAVGPAVMLAANLATGFADLPAVPTTSDRTVKTLYQELGDPREGARIVYSDWNAFARTDVVVYVPKVPKERQPVLFPDFYVYTDGDVPTNMRAFGGDLNGKPANLDRLMAFLPSEARDTRFETAAAMPQLQRFIGFLPFRLQRPQKVLLVGPGGGLDILLAFAVGAKEIDGVELNPSMPKIMRRYAELNGHLYEYSNVNVTIDDGRSYLKRTDKQYDMIYMALTYSATTSGSASLALVESYLHTVEAVRGCLERLAPGGQFVFICAEDRLLLRGFVTALEALQEEGLSRQDALRSLAVIDVWPSQYVLGPYRHMLLVRKQPYSKAESQELADSALAMGLAPGYCPGTYEPIPFNQLTGGGTVEDLDRLLNASMGGPNEITVRPVTDERPFFADLTVGVQDVFLEFVGGGAALLVCIMAATCVAHAFARGDLRLPKPPVRERKASDEAVAEGSEEASEETEEEGAAEAPEESPEGEAEDPPPAEADDSEAPVAPETAEPAESAGEVEAQPEVEECSEDRHPEAPPASKGLIPTAWVAEKALYFAGIGVGFMLIEVCLAQKLILYLGYPTLSFAVILFALLLGGGLGSLFTQSWPVGRLAAGAALGALAAVVLVLGFGPLHGLGRLFDATLPWPILARTIAGAAVLIPLGFFMGTQFPSGLRRLAGPNAALAPWVWATNGVASVLGSVGAMCGAKLWGFQTVLLVGAACYALAAALSFLEHLALAQPPLAEAGVITEP